MRLRPPGDVAAGTLIYLHGGAYALGSAEGYRGLAARLAAADGMTAVVPDYSRSPEARYPVALEEMVAVYSALLAEGLDPKKTGSRVIRRAAGWRWRWRWRCGTAGSPCRRRWG